MSKEYKEPDSPDLERELEIAAHKKDIEMDLAWEKHERDQQTLKETS